ncbi:MAG: hypothetical protein LBD67_01200 [Candidatus Accumulibacter sp.]|nr:hypothetical protein [Accumulibacter sp.]
MSKVRQTRRRRGFPHPFIILLRPEAGESLFFNPFALCRPELVEGNLSKSAFPVRSPCLS